MIITMNQIFTKQGTWFFVIAFVFISLGTTTAFASPPPPGPMQPNSSLVTGTVLKSSVWQPGSEEHNKLPLLPADQKSYSISLKIVTSKSEDFSLFADLASPGAVYEVFSSAFLSPDLVGKKISAKVTLIGTTSGLRWWISDVSVLSKLTITGSVISGGDTTPKNLFGTPRKFMYQVKQDDGAIIKVTYTAYPPSPAGDQEGKKIRLSFHAGSVLIGDYLQARGSFVKSANVLTVAEEGDYIKTSQKLQPLPQKPVTPPDNENNVPTIKSTSEISAMLIEQKQLNSVDDIELSSDEQQYTVKGYRSAKLFFLIPVSMKVELKINAVNGNIEKIKKPWWAFLVR